MLTDADIKLEDLTPDIRQIADVVGLTEALRLARAFSGEQFYWPKFETLSRRARDRRIYEDRKTKTYEQIAHEHNLSTAAVRVICHRERLARHKEPVQLPLFK